jgi:hypothetical protein
LLFEPRGLSLGVVGHFLHLYRVQGEFFDLAFHLFKLRSIFFDSVEILFLLDFVQFSNLCDITIKLFFENHYFVEQELFLL